MVKAGAGKWKRAARGIAAAGVALTTWLIAAPAQGQQGEAAEKAAVARLIPTTTELSVRSEDAGTRSTFTVHVAAPGGTAPAGSVSIRLGEKSLGSALLDEQGVATMASDSLTSGTQRVVAVYEGGSGFAPSASAAATTSAASSGVPDFTFTASTTSLTVKRGSYGTIVVTINPDPMSGFTQNVGLSCGQMPGQIGTTNCVFTPVTVTPTGTAPVSANLNIVTSLPSGGKTELRTPAGAERPVYAFVFPGLLALAGLGAAGRRWARSGAARTFGLALLLIASGLGLSSCSDRYSYLHHVPPVNLGTPLGTFNIVLYATANDGSTFYVKQIPVTLTVTN